MSQVVTRQNIEKVDAIPFSTSSQALSAGKALFDGLANIANIGMRELITGSVDMSHTTLQKLNSVIELRSPNSLRSDFSLNYLTCMKAINGEGISSADKQKTAVIKTVCQMNYLIENDAVIQEKLHKVIASDSKNIKVSIENLMNEIQTQHCNVFSKELTQIVSNASADAGFKQVSKKIKNAVPIITALNENGRGIVSEIRTNQKTKVFDLVSETTDFYDGTCSDALNKFDEALKKYGVKFTNANRKWTGGNCWLPSAEVVQNEKKQKAKKELDRTRQLNKKNKINL